MTEIITDQARAPELISWLNERIPGVDQIEGTVRTLGYADDGELLTVS